MHCHNLPVTAHNTRLKLFKFYKIITAAIRPAALLRHRREQLLAGWFFFFEFIYIK